MFYFSFCTGYEACHEFRILSLFCCCCCFFFCVGVIDANTTPCHFKMQNDNNISFYHSQNIYKFYPGVLKKKKGGGGKAPDIRVVTVLIQYEWYQCNQFWLAGQQAILWNKNFIVWHCVQTFYFTAAFIPAVFIAIICFYCFISLSVTSTFTSNYWPAKAVAFI